MKSERLLTNEELRKHFKTTSVSCRGICEDQDRKTTAALIVWLEEPCINHPFFVKGKTRYHSKRFCPNCWQELKESVKHE